MNILVILLFFSFLGLHAFFANKYKLSLYVTPLMAVCVIILVVYGFGLIGLLSTGLFIIVGIGIVLGIYGLITAPKTLLHWSTAMIIVGCGLLWLRYRNALLLQYDDFSHWGLIARYLLTNNALPDQGATLIHFQSYPPAAACWLYAVGFFAGHGEGVMIAAQAWFLLIAMLPLFAISEKNSIIRSSGIIVVSTIVLSIYHGTASLMVDNLLAALSIGAIAMTVSMRKAPQRNTWPLAVVLTVLCLVKDSGLYFAVVVLGLQFYFTRQRHQSIKTLLPSLLLPVAARLAWSVHIKIAFTAAGTTRHAFTLQNMLTVSSDRTLENFIEISKAVLRSAVSVHNQSLQILFLLVIGCAIIVILRFFKTRSWSFSIEWKLVSSCIVAYGVYLALLLSMYYFTMPIHAAKEAVAFERYNITFALLVYGLFAAYLLATQTTLLPLKRVVPFLLALMLAVPLAFPSYRSGIRRLLSESYRVPVREQIYMLEEKRPLQPHENAALYLGDQYFQQDFVTYIAAYTFQKQMPIYTADTIDTDTLPDILYTLQIEDENIIDAKNAGVEIVTP